MILADMVMPRNCTECVFQSTICENDCCIIGEAFPNNATNGEMLMAIFPDTIIKYMGFEIVVVQIFPEVPIEQQFTVQWWNTMYDREVGTGNKIKRCKE